MLKEIFDRFAHRMARHEFLVRETRDIFRHRNRQLSEQISLESGLDEDERGSSWHFMNFENAFDRRAVSFGEMVLDSASLNAETKSLLNKQFCWLLVAAYEDYEAFLKEIFAFTGKMLPDVWQMKDFGSISISEVSGKKFEWFYGLAKNRRDLPGSILNRYRSKLDPFAEMELHNARNLNLKFLITMISKFRHSIVHNNGIVNDIDEFTKKIIDEAASPRDAQKNTSTIRFYVLPRSGEGHEIILNDRVSSAAERHPMQYHDTIGNLLDYIMTHAHLLYCIVSKAVDPDFVMEAYSQDA